MRRVDRLVLALEHGGHLGGQPAQHDAIGVDDVPATLDVLRLGSEGLHRLRKKIGSGEPTRHSTSVLARASKDPRRVDNAPSVPWNSPVARVLIVDDDPDILNLVQFQLRHHGHRVATAGSADEAEALVDERGSPDVVVLDVMMPDVTGFELLTRLRGREGYGEPPGDLPVRPGAAPRTSSGGRRSAPQYLTKPFMRLGAARGHRQGHRPPAPKTPANGERHRRSESAPGSGPARGPAGRPPPGRGPPGPAASTRGLEPPLGHVDQGADHGPDHLLQEPVGLGRDRHRGPRRPRPAGGGVRTVDPLFGRARQTRRSRDGPPGRAPPAASAPCPARPGGATRTAAVNGSGHGEVSMR